MSGSSQSDPQLDAWLSHYTACPTCKSAVATDAGSAGFCPEGQMLFQSWGHGAYEDQLRLMRLQVGQPQWMQRAIAQLVENPTPDPSWLGPISGLFRLVTLLLPVALLIGVAVLLWRWLPTSGVLGVILHILIVVLVVWAVVVLIGAYRMGKARDRAVDAEVARRLSRDQESGDRV